MHNLTCKECGRVFPYPRRKQFCSAECQHTNWRRRRFGVRVCDQCGEEYLARHATSRFCSEVCTLDHGRFVLQGKKPAERRSCPICGCAFMVRRDYSRSHEQQFCSKACAGKAQRRPWLERQRRVYRRKCEMCGRHFWLRHKRRRRFCSVECKRSGYARAQRERRAASYSPVVATKHCKECGKEFTTSFYAERRLYCSRRCAVRRMGRIGNATRRARLRASTWENIDPVAVCERGGWRCAICGVSTPRRLRGTLHDRAPEADHIVPVALGGGHTWDNLQCLCRDCNNKKGATTFGQLRLAL